MNNLSSNQIPQISRLLRYLILEMTTNAGSGHPTSSLSAVEMMSTLFWGGHFHYDVNNPSHPNRDRLIFSKGHAAPLFYSLFAIAGGIKFEELMNLRKSTSNLEGHPTMNFPFTEIPTGSLGQGLSIGAGMAYAAKFLNHLPYKTYVLLGDSEMSEGSNFEAMQFASFYSLNNLVALVDINRLGQRGETMWGWDVEKYKNFFEAFGWQTWIVDGHDEAKLLDVYEKINHYQDKPTAILCKTIKGKGVHEFENLPSWHGKTLPKEKLNIALSKLGEIKKNNYPLNQPSNLKAKISTPISTKSIQFLIPTATRKAYGAGLLDVLNDNPNLMVLDAEMSNSTFSQMVKEVSPINFLECFIMEQNMVGVGLGLAKCGKTVFLSSFGSFLSRAFDQIRMAQYSLLPLVICGSHVGVSMGADGYSQMALEDIAFFRTLHDSVVFSPSDAVSCKYLTKLSSQNKGITYLRTFRNDVSVIYQPDEIFPISDVKVHMAKNEDTVAIIATGYVFHEAMKAAEVLNETGINTRVIDAYCLKPLDKSLLLKALGDVNTIITVADHRPEGGLGEIIRSTLMNTEFQIFDLAVSIIPHSGTTEETLKGADIDRDSIISLVKKISNT